MSWLSIQSLNKEGAVSSEHHDCLVLRRYWEVTAAIMFTGDKGRNLEGGRKEGKEGGQKTRRETDQMLVLESNPLPGKMGLGVCLIWVVPTPECWNDQSDLLTLNDVMESGSNQSLVKYTNPKVATDRIQRNRMYYSKCLTCWEEWQVVSFPGHTGVAWERG